MVLNLKELMVQVIEMIRSNQNHIPEERENWLTLKIGRTMLHGQLKIKEVVDLVGPSQQLEQLLPTVESIETSGMIFQSKTLLIVQERSKDIMIVMGAEVDGCHGVSNTSLIEKELF